MLDLFERENLLARANELGDRFQRRAREWQRRWSIIGDVRGLGGMQAIELVQSQETKAPAADETKKITQYCYEHGLITITAGSYSNVIRVLVPLVITNEQMDEALDVLESAIAACVQPERRGSAAGLKSCHPEGGLIFAPKREVQPQSKDPYKRCIMLLCGIRTLLSTYEYSSR